MDPDGGEVEGIFEELRKGKLNAEYIIGKKKPIFHKIKIEKEKRNKGRQAGKKGILYYESCFFHLEKQVDHM